MKILNNDMILLKQTNRGDIKIYSHPEFGIIAICSRENQLGFELCRKYAEKNGARIPNIHEMNLINFRKPTKDEIDAIRIKSMPSVNDYKPFNKPKYN